MEQNNKPKDADSNKSTEIEVQRNLDKTDKDDSIVDNVSQNDEINQSHKDDSIAEVKQPVFQDAINSTIVNDSPVAKTISDYQDDRQKFSQDTATQPDLIDPLDETPKTMIFQSDADSNTANNDSLTYLQEQEQKKKDELDKKKNQSIASQSIYRYLNNTKIRLVLAVGACFVIGGTYFALSGNNQEIKTVNDSKQSAIPTTKIKGSASLTKEQEQYLNTEQLAEAEQALRDGKTYVPAITKTSTDTPASEPLSENPIVFGSESSLSPNNQKIYIDKATNKTYSANEAMKLLQENKKIDGVTYGVGSITDTTAKAVDSTNQNTSAKQKVENYVVQPLGSRSQSGEKIQTDFSANQKQSLNNANEQVDQWGNEYLNLRLKKAQIADAKAQASFETQVTALESAFAQKANQSKFAKVEYELKKKRAVTSSNNDSSTTQAPQTTTSSISEKPLIYAGETVTAYLNSEVNTDNGTEVIATIRSGKLKGAMIVGTVKQTNNNIQFTFTRILRKNGLPELAVNAFGRQIGTNSLGMADDINNHYLQRYSALILSSGLSGVGEAYEQTSGTSASYSTTGVVLTEASDPSNKRIVGNIVGELGDQISGEIKQHSNRKPTYITQSGKIFNIFFNQNVVEKQQ